MATATPKHSKAKKSLTIVRDYDIAADAKNRISLRGAKAKYFHVQALSNGCYVLVRFAEEARSSYDKRT